MKKDKNDSNKIIAQNREARHRYEIKEIVEAGLMLTGTEVKSLRAGKAQMMDSFAYVKNGEAYLSHLHISEYTHGNRENHVPTRVRKLLLHKHQIEQLAAAVNEKGFTLVPTQLYFVKGRVKVELGIGKGKKLHDKRATLKERDAKKELAQIKKRSAKD
jgi:SsrA-binding protein